MRALIKIPKRNYSTSFVNVIVTLALRKRYVSVRVRSPLALALGER
jgi:hypothetical protein